MALDLVGPRATLAALLMPYTVEAFTRTPVATERCGRATPLRGEIGEREGVREARGRYRLTLPATTTLELQPEEEVRFADLPGRIFRVVWTPPPSTLNLARVYGIDEVGR